MYTGKFDPAVWLTKPVTDSEKREFMNAPFLNETGELEAQLRILRGADTPMSIAISHLSRCLNL